MFCESERERKRVTTLLRVVLGEIFWGVKWTLNVFHSIIYTYFISGLLLFLLLLLQVRKMLVKSQFMRFFSAIEIDVYAYLRSIGFFAFTYVTCCCCDAKEYHQKIIIISYMHEFLCRHNP